MPAHYRILAITADRVTELRIDKLTPIGGKKSAGIALAGLKHDGDYAILASVENGISLHPLRGSSKGATSRTTTLGKGQVFHVEDLAIFVQEMQASADVNPLENPVIEPFQKVLQSLTTQTTSQKPLDEVLRLAMEISGHDHGLVMSQDLNGEYEVLSSRNLDATQNWLSESLVQTALRTREPVLIQNVMGSQFDVKKSLMATRFLSIFCWPLVIQGKVIGALLTGSRRPYAREIQDVKPRVELAAHFASVVLDFYLREVRLKNELTQYKIEKLSGPFLTQDPVMSEVSELARKVAPSDLSILVQGETGVGKEVLCRWIHQNSERKNAPFIAVNCAAIPSELLESTLFGHKRGAFTGAVADHVGKIQQAQGGTLFLDEIGDLSLSLQAKLLRVLQERVVEPVGSSKAIPVDIRLICATHKNLAQMIEQKSFRDDFYYRIAQITLALPPLRERPSDIRLLTQQFLKEADSKKHLSQEAWSFVHSQSWPGNIRELKSAVQRAVLLSSGDELQAKDFRMGSSIESNPVKAKDANWLGGMDLESAKQAFIRAKIEQALSMTSGNRTRAAELLGVTPRTLFRYLESDRPMTELS